MPPADVLLAVARSADISIDELSRRRPEGAQAQTSEGLGALEGQVATLTEVVNSLQKATVASERQAVGGLIDLAGSDRL